MLNSIVSVIMKSFIESKSTKILGNYNKDKNFGVSFLWNFHGVVVRALDCCAGGLWFESHWKWFEIFSIFSKTDSMSDFILTLIFEFNIKSYVNSEIARSWQKISVK